MAHRFTSQTQERLFFAVLGQLRKIGYRDSLLLERYDFADHFSSLPSTVTAPAAAFGQLPPDPNSACFAVALTNGDSGASLIARYRALGAPRALEVRDDSVVHWRVSANVSEVDRQNVISPSQLDGIFHRNRDAWNPSSVMRAKNIAPITGGRQRDFIDAGLMPALESHVHEKLDPLLRGILNAARLDFRRRNKKEPDSDRLFRLVFRALTGKMMHDRDLEPFNAISGPDSPRKFLREVAQHYNDPKPIIDDLETQRLVLSRLWSGMGFANLSIDVLAFVWENTLVTSDIRKAHGIHATPPNVARFVARALIGNAPDARRVVVEPCAGSGTFLIAALQCIKELLPPDTNLRRRHEYFANTLRGFETESFGIEVSQSSLTMADFPNHNGWYLKDEDVFGSQSESPHFISSLKKARFVLCNPPFEAFSESQRGRYQSQYARGPVELLHRVLDLIPPDAEIGFVLPHTVIDGQPYSELRRKIGERFSDLQVVQLPEGIFKKARFPSALLIAKNPNRHRGTQVSFSYVSSADDFVQRGTIDRTEVARKSLDELEQSLSIAELGELWDFLSCHPKVSSAVSEIARGVEWESDTKGHVLDSPRGGALPGFHTSKELRCFESPPISFLVPEDKKYLAWDRPWHLPKVVCNAVRKRQVGPWKIAACPVDLNLICTQNFTVLWPKAPWTAKSLAAVMNGPIACAFMACHETWKHITKENLRELPVPTLDNAQIATLDNLVGHYQRVAALKRDGLFDDRIADRQLTSLLKDIDSIVLLAYGLPEDLVEDLVMFFEDHNRPASVQYDIEELLDHEPLSDATEREAEDASALWSVFESSLHDDRV